ncbi:MAG: 4Fe-4S binding protein [Eggerthellaceae bacterium]|nr:4Fe-4S binding protein [Eggerthellaceae bacterium]
MASGDKTNRITVTFKPDRCLHSRSTRAECSRCMDSCPSGAIRRHHLSSMPELNPTACMQCGQCLSACPVEAFEAPDFTERQLLARVGASGPLNLRCLLPYGALENLSLEYRTYQLGTCLAALSSGGLFELALDRTCTLVTDRCATCPVFRGAKATMGANVTGAFLMLRGIGRAANLRESTPLFLPSRQENEEIDDERRRREGVKSSIHALFSGRAKAPEGVGDMEMRRITRHVPAWRRRLKDLWIHRGFSADGLCTYEWPELVVDPGRCLACGMCMQMCPTGTIVHAFDGSSFSYRFVPGTCADCRLCLTVCAHGALSRSYRSYPNPFDQQDCCTRPARPCAVCGRPVPEFLVGDLCFHCRGESRRAPLEQQIRAQLGVLSYGDLERRREEARGRQD